MTTIYSDDDFEFIGDGINLYTCINCGAIGPNKRHIKHYPLCKPSDSVNWAKYYSKIDCPDCGHENPEGSTKCTKCNAPLEEQDGSTSTNRT